MIKRFEPTENCGCHNFDMIEDPNGDYVKIEDYKKLEEALFEAKKHIRDIHNIHRHKLYEEINKAFDRFIEECGGLDVLKKIRT